MTYKEQLEILRQPFVTNADIQRFYGVKKNKSCEVTKQLREYMFEHEIYQLDSRRFPTDIFIKVKNIDIEYIKTMAEL